jgi:hypothetical protein
MADWVDIVLMLTGETFRLPREFILTQMPESLFASALELDPTATQIPIMNSVVTPAVMQFLVNYSQGYEPERSLPELVAAERYLNAPWILYYADPGYDQIPQRLQPNAEVNISGIHWIIQNNRPWAYGYLLMKGYDPPYSDLELAVHSNASDIAQLIQSHKQFTPQPDTQALVQILNDDLNAKLKEEFMAAGDSDDQDMKELIRLISEHKFEKAYEFAHDLDTVIRDNLPEILWDIFDVIFNRDTVHPEDYAKAWSKAQTIRWIPELPAEPANIFQNIAPFFSSDLEIE